MKPAWYALAVAVFLLSGSVWGQQWMDWTGTANNYTILYRYRMLNSGKTCDLEFKDENQGDRYTTFDAAVDYQSTSEANSAAPVTPNDNNTPNNPKSPGNTRVKKTAGEHIVTARDHNGSAQIPNCFGIAEVRVSFVQRQ